MRRKEERSKQSQTNNKAKQHSTPTVVTSPKKNELPRVGLEPTTLYTLDRALYMYCSWFYKLLDYFAHQTAGNEPEAVLQKFVRQLKERGLSSSCPLEREDER